MPDTYDLVRELETQRARVHRLRGRIDELIERAEQARRERDEAVDRAQALVLRAEALHLKECLELRAELERIQKRCDRYRKLAWRRHQAFLLQKQRAEKTHEAELAGRRFRAQQRKEQRDAT